MLSAIVFLMFDVCAGMRASFSDGKAVCISTKTESISKSQASWVQSSMLPPCCINLTTSGESEKHILHKDVTSLKTM
jgi:hypothetical protein